MSMGVEFSPEGGPHSYEGSLMGVHPSGQDESPPGEDNHPQGKGRYLQVWQNNPQRRVVNPQGTGQQ